MKRVCFIFLVVACFVTCSCNVQPPDLQPPDLSEYTLLLRVGWLSSQPEINQSCLLMVFDNNSYKAVVVTSGKVRIDKGDWVDFECYVPIESLGVNKVKVTINRAFSKGWHNLELELYNSQGVILCKWMGAVECE